MSSIIYALVGCAIIYLFQQRRRQLALIRNDMFPEFDEESYKQFVLLLKMAYERTLYMGVLFFPLAWATRSEGSQTSQLFFLVLIAFLFISNIIPRHKVLKLIEENELTVEELRKRGVTL